MDYPRTVGQVQKYDGCNGIPEEKIERDRRNVWSHNDWEFSPINVRHQSTDPGSSENTEQDKSPPHIIFKLQKVKERNILKEDGGWRLTYKGAEVRIASDISETMQASKKRVHWSVWSVKGKKQKQSTNLEFCTLWNYPSRVKEKYFLKQKLKEFIASIPTLQEMLKSSSDRRKTI